MSQPLARRDFLKISLSGAAALSVLGPDAAARRLTPLERKAPAKRVIIVGAGLAGLAAAYELTQVGHEVTVYEARLQPGGRVSTLREPFADGLYAEAGARGFSDSCPRLLHYAKLFDVPFAPLPAEAFATLFFLQGKRLVAAPGQSVDWPYDLTAEERRLGPLGILMKYVSPTLKEIGDPSRAGFRLDVVKQYDQMSFNEFLRRQGASNGAVELLRPTMWFGEFAEANSALQALVSYLGLFFQGQKLYAFRDGNDRLPHALAARLPERIRYGAPVTKINHGPDGVEAVFHQNGADQTVAADHLICAVPFSHLRYMEVSPPLGAEKQAMIQELEYVHVARIYLQVRSRFWETHNVTGAALTDLPIMEVAEEPFPRPEPATPRSILEAVVTGAGAQHVADMEEGERIQFALEHMEKVHPEIRQYAEGGTSMFWGHGAYSQFAPGQVMTWLPLGARADGRLHFAGEHTSYLAGTMEGALESGQRAAREVNEAS